MHSQQETQATNSVTQTLKSLYDEIVPLLGNNEHSVTTRFDGTYTVSKDKECADLGIDAIAIRPSNRNCTRQASILLYCDGEVSTLTERPMPCSPYEALGMVQAIACWMRPEIELPHHVIRMGCEPATVRLGAASDSSAPRTPGKIDIPPAWARQS